MTETLRKRIYEACTTIVHFEDAFIELAFEVGGIEGLTAYEVRQYIRYIADRRLMQLGLKDVYLVNHNPLPWLDEMLNGVEHTNFLKIEQLNIQKAATTGSWEEVFTEMDAKSGG